MKTIFELISIITFQFSLLFTGLVVLVGIWELIKLIAERLP